MNKHLFFRHKRVHIQLLVFKKISDMQGRALSNLHSRAEYLINPAQVEPACQCRRCQRCRLDPWIRKIPWRRKWQPTLVFLPGESHGQRRLVCYSPEHCKESDTTEAT